RLRELASERGVTEASEGQGLMEEVITGILTTGMAATPDGSGPGGVQEHDLPGSRGGQPRVVLVVGVNGCGKTTSIGKLAWRSKQEGLKPLVVACDTFRAAALEQLDIWANRAGAEIIRSQSGSDPAAVAFDGVRAGQARGAGVVFVDTAGRLQTNANLMGELSKIRRVIGKAQPGAPHETLLVLDATVGQNALSQVRHFSDAAGVTGILLAKLDGSAKGGVILAVSNKLGVPVRYVGLGEGIEDLEEFQPVSFAKALLEPMEVSD
ncbi:MAG: signal recognition particle-docking protein FtsY, partial [Candidatus Eisenbacteria sp.]|nr:signal recognition particle-docking protein FtsY [Candidatus Eisenbacteria bacterium]